MKLAIGVDGIASRISASRAEQLRQRAIADALAALAAEARRRGAAPAAEPPASENASPEIPPPRS